MSTMATELLRRWREGDEEAANELFQLYAGKLTVLAERHLSTRLSSRLDGEDVVQSVFRSFFCRTAEGQFKISSSSDLWHLLVRITMAKVRDQARRHTAGQRDVKAEQGGGEAWLFEALTNEPGPVEALTLLDQIEAILEGLPDDCGEILALALEGRSRTEIAQQLDVSRQTVYRILALLQQRLQKLEKDAG